MDGTSPEKKNHQPLPTPGGAIPAPGAAVPTPGTAVPAPGFSAPGGATPPPAPGTAVPAPGLSTPGFSAPGAPGAVVPVVMPTPGSAVVASTGTKQETHTTAQPDGEKVRDKPRPLRVQLIKPLTRRQWAMTLSVLFAGVLVASVVAVIVAKWLVGLEPVAQFINTYPGKYDNPAHAPVGIPAWLGWQHFLNMFFLVLIIKTGIQINRERRPKGFWTPKKGGKKISLNLWIHLSLDLFWVLNGLAFYLLLFATGQWMRIVPTSWEFFPNAISAGLQYLSLNWPTENGWANYNSLQELTYFITVFIAAPLSIISGFRMSAYWPSKNKVLGTLVPMELARKIHFPVMVFYLVFAMVHVFLVFATGALRNLNHMYASQDDPGWTGFWWFLASMVAIAGGIVAVRPSLLAPVATLFGQVTAR